MVKTKIAPDFTPVVLARLRAAGWTHDRSVPTTIYAKAFAVEKLPLLAKAKAFLRHFGGLIIRYETKAHQQDVLEFLADRAVVGLGGGIKGFEDLIGVAPLCPIGHYQFGTSILFMDRKGRVFGGSDETATLIGKTGEQAICNILCSGAC